MARQLLLALAVGGAIAAAGTALAVRDAASWQVVAGSSHEAGMTSAAAPAMHDWPICSALSPATSIDGSDPDLAAGRTALGIGDWKMALAALKLAEMRDPRNADIQHLAGYAYQRLGLFGPAIRHYQQALAFNRRHRSAHGDLGELYLALKEPFKSEAHLAMLEDICLIPCEELAALKRAIASYRALAVH